MISSVWLDHVRLPEEETLTQGLEKWAQGQGGKESAGLGDQRGRRQRRETQQEVCRELVVFGMS